MGHSTTAQGRAGRAWFQPWGPPPHGRFHPAVRAPRQAAGGRALAAAGQHTRRKAGKAGGSAGRGSSSSRQDTGSRRAASPAVHCQIGGRGGGCCEDAESAACSQDAGAAAAGCAAMVAPGMDGADRWGKPACLKAGPRSSHAHACCAGARSASPTLTSPPHHLRARGGTSALSGTMKPEAFLCCACSRQTAQVGHRAGGACHHGRRRVGPGREHHGNQRPGGQLLAAGG